MPVGLLSVGRNSSVGGKRHGAAKLIFGKKISPAFPALALFQPNRDADSRQHAGGNAESDIHLLVRAPALLVARQEISEKFFRTIGERLPQLKLRRHVLAIPVR